MFNCTREPPKKETMCWSFLSPARHIEFSSVFALLADESSIRHYTKEKRDLGDLFFLWCTLVEVFRTKYYQVIVAVAKEISVTRQYLDEDKSLSRAV